MDDALARNAFSLQMLDTCSLNPCCNGWCTRTLAIVENEINGRKGLNPCCNGWCTRTFQSNTAKALLVACLNPCCNGWCTRTQIIRTVNYAFHVVLILVVMDDALAQLTMTNFLNFKAAVLILVVMDDALAQNEHCKNTQRNWKS